MLSQIQHMVSLAPITLFDVAAGGAWLLYYKYAVLNGVGEIVEVKPQLCERAQHAV